MEEEFTKLSIKELITKAVDPELAREDQKRVKDLLESMYTSMVYKCIDNALARDPNSLVFQDEEKLKIDMGIISDEAYMCGESRHTIQEAWNNRTPSYRLKLLYLSDWLEEFYLNNQDFGINNSKQLENKIKEIEDDIFQNQLETINLQQDIELLHKQLSDLRDIDSALKYKVKTYILSRNLEQLEGKLLNSILDLKWKQKYGELTGKEETTNLSKFILEQSKVKALRNNILEELKKPYNKPLIAKQFLELYDKIEKLKTDQFMSEKLNISLADKKKKFDEKLSSFQIPKKVEIMRKETNRILILLRTCGNRSKIINPTIVHIFEKFVQVQEAITAIDQINGYDPTLFSNSHRQCVGLPYVLISPGQGNGLYDIENNCMILPASSDNLMESVADMLADYRLGTDVNNNLMKSCKGEIQLGDILENSLEFGKFFKHYYIVWVTKEVQGNKVLDQNVRNWFKSHISPKNDQVKIPNELLVLHPKDFADAGKRMEEELKENPNSALLYLKLGAIKAISEHHLDRSLECFLQALKLDPKLHDAEYNIAQIYMKIGKEREAIDYFQKYSSHNYHNWWTAIAQRWIQIMER